MQNWMQRITLKLKMYSKIVESKLFVKIDKIDWRKGIDFKIFRLFWKFLIKFCEKARIWSFEVGKAREAHVEFQAGKGAMSWFEFQNEMMLFWQWRGVEKGHKLKQGFGDSVAFQENLIDSSKGKNCCNIISYFKARIGDISMLFSIKFNCHLHVSRNFC